MTLPEPYADSRRYSEKFGTSKQRGKPSPAAANSRDSGRGRVVWQLEKPGVREQQEVCYRHAIVECGIISARGKLLGIQEWNEIFRLREEFESVEVCVETRRAETMAGVAGNDWPKREQLCKIRSSATMSAETAAGADRRSFHGTNHRTGARVDVHKQPASKSVLVRSSEEDSRADAERWSMLVETIAGTSITSTHNKFLDCLITTVAAGPQTSGTNGYSHSFVCIHPKCEDLWRKNDRSEGSFPMPLDTRTIEQNVNERTKGEMQSSYGQTSRRKVHQHGSRFLRNIEGMYSKLVQYGYVTSDFVRHATRQVRSAKQAADVTDDADFIRVHSTEKALKAYKEEADRAQSCSPFPAYFTCENLASCVTCCSALVRQRLSKWRRSETGRRRNNFVQHPASMKEKFKQDDNAENQTSGLAATNHQCVRRILVGGTAECYQHWRTRKLLRSRRFGRFLFFVFDGLFPESEGGTKHQRTTIVYLRDVRTSTKTTWRSLGTTRDERRDVQYNDVPELPAQMQACSRIKVMNVWITWKVVQGRMVDEPKKISADFDRRTS